MVRPLRRSRIRTTRTLYAGRASTLTRRQPIVTTAYMTSVLGQIGRRLGQRLGRILTDILGRRARSRRPREQAADLLDELGIDLPTSPGDPGFESDLRDAVEELEEVLPPPRPPQAPPGSTGAPDGGRPPRRTGAVVTEPRWSGRQAVQPDRPGEESSLSPEHRTHASSNVYSFQYDYASSTLLVRFKAPILNTRHVFNLSGSGIAGTPGRTHLSGKRPDQPGPLYGYLDVPVRVFKRLVAARSAGGAVWDELRVRGTIYGHQYRYLLMQGAVVPGENGQLGTYVPRRATVKGFRKRAVPHVGTGRRGWINSSLPEQIRAAPDRATPDRGQRPLL